MDRISSVITTVIANVEVANCEKFSPPSLKFVRQHRMFRLGKGAFPQTNASTKGSTTNGENPSDSTTNSSNNNDSSGNTNTPLSKRLRQTEKRLRKIYSLNNLSTKQEENRQRNERISNVSTRPARVTSPVLTVKRSSPVYRNKNGQFASPTNASEKKMTIEKSQQQKPSSSSIPQLQVPTVKKHLVKFHCFRSVFHPLIQSICLVYSK